MTSLLDGLTGDPLFNGPEGMPNIRTGWNEGRHLTFVEFCRHHEMDGNIFKEAIEALGDLPTAAVTESGRQITLREVGVPNTVLMVDYLLGGDANNEVLLHAWVYAAIFLARHPDWPVPDFMRPVPS